MGSSLNEESTILHKNNRVRQIEKEKFKKNY